MSEITLAGYSTTKDVVAQQVTRGGKLVYVVSLPIQLIPIHLPIPDPNRPIDSNRAVSKTHAESFGNYWLKQPDSWTVPPLLVDTPENLPFTQEFNIVNGPKLGILKIPDYSNRTLRTLDGQHRILGWSIIRDQLLKQREVALEQYNQAVRSGTAIEKQITSENLKDIKANLSRMETEQVTLEIITGVSELEHKTFFITIADNAQGINTTERTRLDELNMTSRVAKLLIDLVPLLTHRVEERKSSVGKGSEHLLTLGSLRDITRHTAFGIKGKVTMVREKQFDDQNALDIAKRFFLAMTDAVPLLNEIIEGRYLPKTLRQESLLGSTTIWRCLAGSYNDLAVTVIDNRQLIWNKEGHDKFVAMARDVFRKMKITVGPDGRKIVTAWAETDCFNPGEVAPRSRAQDLKNLSALFTLWAESGIPFQPKRIAK